MKGNYIQIMKDKLYGFKERRYFKALVAGTLTTLIGAALVVGLVMPRHTSGQSYGLKDSPAATSKSSDTPIVNPRSAAFSFADIVQKVSPSVVTIRSDIKTKQSADVSQFFNDPFFRQFFGGQAPKQQPRMEHALGSGVIVRADGVILTNNHVVDGAQKITVEFPDRTTYTAKVVGTDPLSDLAVLRIDAKNLPALPMGDSDKVRVGDVVLAIGNPLGLRQTVTSGIISAKGRQTGLSDGSFEDFLQTDAPINQGNSGGALVDVDGELIGINSQILSPSGGNIGIGFAIPSNMAKSVLNQLLATGKVHRGMLGIGIQDLTSGLAKSFGMKDDNGVLVNSVKEGSPAAAAGMKQGDVVVAFNGEKVTDANGFRNKVANEKPGTTVDLTVFRNGSEVNLKAKLTEFTLEKGTVDESGDSQGGTDDSTGGKLGLTVEPLTPPIANRLNLENVDKGVVITQVASGSKAEDAGLRQGDVILQINRKPVSTLEEVRSAITSSGDGPVLLLVDRANQTFFLTL